VLFKRKSYEQEHDKNRLEKVLCAFHNSRARLSGPKGKEAKKPGDAKTVRCGTPC